MIRNASGMISVFSRKWMTSCSSVWRKRKIQDLRAEIFPQNKTEHYLDKSTDNSKTCKPEIFEWSRLALGVEKGIQIERDISTEELRAGFLMRSHALQQGQRVAHTVRVMGLKQDEKYRLRNFSERKPTVSPSKADIATYPKTFSLWIPFSEPCSHIFACS